MATIVSLQTLTTSLQHLYSSSSPQLPRLSSIPSSSLSTPTPLSFNLTTRRRFAFVSKASSTANFSPEIGDFISGVSIFTASGESVMFSWELASALKESKLRLDSAGVKLIAIGVGEPKKAQILAERLLFPLDSLYADPERKAYDVLGLYYGLGRTFFNPASTKVFSRFEAVKNAVKNYTIEATPDDRSSVLQQGGMFVFKGKELLYAWKDEGTGDHAPMDAIIDVCCKSPVA